VRYATDELPPIIYAPSASVLALLAERPRLDGPLSLLTVCDPSYPLSDGGKEPPRDLPALPLAFRGQLQRLPGTAAESDRIKRFFDKAEQLRGEAATEKALAAAVSGKRVIHIAAHGFADQRFGNLFGALALMPPTGGRATAANDGFLSLHEICALPLQQCELAVLSACVTNVGPQRPLEAGVTLASGFLTAGARRVVASHWSVDDESTALLMATFFEEVTAAARRGERPDYARALQKARQKVRGRSEWSAPYFWAPFVLIGPAR
jgi:CHAT domain-containing protein